MFVYFRSVGKYSGVRGYIPQKWRINPKSHTVAGSISAGALEFFIDIKSFRSHYGPGVDSASNRNEHFLGVKAASAQG